MTNREPRAAPVPHPAKPRRPGAGPAPAMAAVQDITDAEDREHAACAVRAFTGQCGTE
ncbi:hypothetical protein ACFVH0_31785 [Streptomyces sp. NPDC127117]|uniref:hypothetical protein n=1 Tax=Streptomyces sp. NPDC127117 TaxID=3345368 RepID=UPI0036321B7C